MESIKESPALKHVFISRPTITGKVKNEFCECCLKSNRNSPFQKGQSPNNFLSISRSQHHGHIKKLPASYVGSSVKIPI